MSIDKLVAELKGNGFKVIKKGCTLRLIKNSKVLIIEENNWNSLDENQKVSELMAIYTVFN